MAFLGWSLGTVLSCADLALILLFLRPALSLVTANYSILVFIIIKIINMKINKFEYPSLRPTSDLN
jgi:hypothetical protein